MLESSPSPRSTRIRGGVGHATQNDSARSSQPAGTSVAKPAELSWNHIWPGKLEEAWTSVRLTSPGAAV